MPAVQRNLQWFRYVDNSGRNWGIRMDQDWGNNAASGCAAFNAADPPFGPSSRRHHPRKVQYQDPTTFRTATFPVCTSAALAALPATLAVTIPGETTAVTYNLAARIDEKLQIPKVSRNNPDHA